MSSARVAVIGAGWWASLCHLPSLAENPNAELVAIADANPDKLRAAQDRFDIPHGYASAADLLAAQQPDAVVVALPHRHHYAAARAALDAGAHVLVEKPMTIDPDEAWDLVARAKSGGRHLLVGYPFQWTRHANAARELIASGRLGELRMASACYSSMAEGFLSGHPEEYDGIDAYPMSRPDPATYADPAVAGGGQGQTQLTHALSNLLYVSGDRAHSATAQMRSFGLAVELALTLQLELDGGGLAGLASIGSLKPGQPAQQDCRYYFSDGLLLQDVVNGTLSAHTNDGQTMSWEPLTAQELYPSRELSATLVELALGRGTNYGPAELGAHSVEILASAYASAAQDGARVPVRADPA